MPVKQSKASNAQRWGKGRNRCVENGSTWADRWGGKTLGMEGECAEIKKKDTAVEPIILLQAPGS